jgi:hypothetical protein
METGIIVTLGVMLLIALLQIRNKNFDIKVLTYELDAQEKANICNVKKQKDLQSQIERLKSNLEIREKALKKAKESDAEYRNLKYTELETKYKSSLVKINERDEMLRNKDIEIMALSADANAFNKGYIGLDNEVNDLQKSIDKKDAIIKLRDSEIFKLKKWHTNLTSVSKKNDEIIQDFILRITTSEKQKDAAIKKANKAFNLCKESVATVAQLRAELDSLEVLLTKYTPQPLLSL